MLITSEDKEAKVSHSTQIPLGVKKHVAVLSKCSGASECLGIDESRRRETKRELRTANTGLVKTWSLGTEELAT